MPESTHERISFLGWHLPKSDAFTIYWIYCSDATYLWRVFFRGLLRKFDASMWCLLLWPGVLDDLATPRGPFWDQWHHRFFFRRDPQRWGVLPGAGQGASWIAVGHWSKSRHFETAKSKSLLSQVVLPYFWCTRDGSLFFLHHIYHNPYIILHQEWHWFPNSWLWSIARLPFRLPSPRPRSWSSTTCGRLCQSIPNWSFARCCQVPADDSCQKN